MTTDAELPSDSRLDDKWATTVFEQLQTFNTELGQLNSNLASFVAQTGTPMSASAARDEPSYLPAKPLAVRIDETVAAMGHEIQSLTDNIARLTSQGAA